MFDFFQHLCILKIKKYIMKQFNELISLGNQGSSFLAKQFDRAYLKKLLEQLNSLDKNNNSAFDHLIQKTDKSISPLELKAAWENKERLNKLKDMVADAIFLIEKRELEESVKTNSVFYIEAPIALNLNKEIQISELTPIAQEIIVPQTKNIQFLYNQNNLRVTHELSFQVDFFFEPFAQIPLRLQNK